MTNDTVLETRHLVAGYERREVLHDVNLRVASGNMLALIGPNGSGKSTLIRALSGVIPPMTGEVLLHGRSLASCGRRHVARHIAVVPQMSPMFFAFTALEFVIMGRTPHLGRLQAESAHDRRIAADAMVDTETEHLRDRPITELSGGELQRLIIARCLAQQAPIMLLDEPTAFLDINHQIQILSLLHSLNTGQDKTIVCVSHNLNLTAAFFDNIVLLSDGRIAAQGPPDEIVTTERISQVYGADVQVDRTASGRPRVTVPSPPARRRQQ